MGKCKKRTLYNTNNCSTRFMTREDAVSDVFKMFNRTKNIDIKKAVNTISLFGITAEELSEAGVSYENLNALGSVIS
ncbi:MAG: hypothetical protein IJ877_02830 [Candidatus Gastranaerophilales bacterium]|nr:hypothetical protein [Candidatus Gastranaerophilales bacterium]